MTLPAPSLLLRVASVLTLLFAAGHAMGAIDSWSPIGDSEVLRAMREVEFEVQGLTRTYWHFYYGFGVYIAILLSLQAVVTWQLAPIARAETARSRPVIATLALASLTGTLVVWRYIFAMPALFSLSIAVCLAVAYVSARQAECR
jgi:hypothetical protein